MYYSSALRQLAQPPWYPIAMENFEAGDTLDAKINQAEADMLSVAENFSPEVSNPLEAVKAWVAKVEDFNNSRQK